MRRWPAFLLALLSSAVMGGPAGAECPPRGVAIQVRVATPQVEVAYRTDLDRKELANLAGMAAVHDDGILGLTISRYALRASSRNAYGRTADGRVCLWVAEIDAVLSIPDMTVYVAREYTPDSCQHRAVMEHEQEHVRITGGLVAPFARQLEAEMRRRLSAVMPVVARSAAAAEAEATRQMEQVMAELLDRLETQRERANAHIDTEESYRRTADQCDGW